MEERGKYVIVAALCLLLIFSGFQAVQINALEDAMEEGEFTPSPPKAGSSNPLGSQAQIPAMVGGC